MARLVVDQATRESRGGILPLKQVFVKHPGLFPCPAGDASLIKQGLDASLAPEMSHSYGKKEAFSGIIADFFSDSLRKTRVSVINKLLFQLFS